MSVNLDVNRLIEKKPSRRFVMILLLIAGVPIIGGLLYLAFNKNHNKLPGGIETNIPITVTDTTKPSVHQKNSSGSNINAGHDVNITIYGDTSRKKKRAPQPKNAISIVQGANSTTIIGNNNNVNGTQIKPMQLEFSVDSLNISIDNSDNHFNLFPTTTKYLTRLTMRFTYQLKLDTLKWILKGVHGIIFINHYADLPVYSGVQNAMIENLINHEVVGYYIPNPVNATYHFNICSTKQLPDLQNRITYEVQ